MSDDDEGLSNVVLGVERLGRRENGRAWQATNWL